MGLDMYLTKRTYVKNWKHMTEDELHQITVTKGGKPSNIKPERICDIIEQVGYWRKANAIHNWFVQTQQGGVDDCREARVDREALEELQEIVTVILAEPADKRDAMAMEKLPPTGGFFFGSTDLDEWFYQTLEETKKILDTVLAEDDDGDYYYHSSW